MEENKMNKEEEDISKQQQNDAAQAEQEAEQDAIEHSVDEIRTKMAEKLKELSAVREAVESIGKKLQTQREAQREQWEKEHENEIGALNKGKEELSNVETELRALGLADYAITREKKLLGGLGIRIMKKLEYEPGKAFNWAEKHGIGLALDKRAFESFAKSQENDLKKAKLDFVEFKEEPITTIPKEIKIKDE